MVDETATCASCGTHNRVGRRFCRSCGAELGLTCARCGATNEPGDRFCGTCGSELGAAAPGPPGTPVAVDGSGGGRTGSGSSVASDARVVTERRLVSVLFADLVGSTGLAEGQDPELVRELLSRYYDAARTIVGRYGGTVEKFIGDAIAAVWGAPVAHEDDAERAVRAALELVDAVGSLDPGPGLPALAARAAVLTGEVAAIAGDEAEGIATGDLMNSASRLQGAAAPGAVIVGEGTVRATEAAIVYEALGPVELRGRSAPVEAWRALRVVAGVGGARRAARLEAPFVGRDDVLRLLKELFHSTARERRSRLVSVTGIGGIGKSRLAWELEKYLDGLAEPVYWHAGRSPAYGEGLAFRALTEMVRGRAGIVDGDDAATATAKLAATLDAWLTDPEERAWVEPRLAALLGAGEMPSGGTEELFAAWRTLFERIADREPTVLVFEDLHWADDGLLDFIERLVPAGRNRPILVLTLARPELLERRPTWGAGVRSLTTVELGPLDDDAMELLLVGLAPGLPPEAIRAIRTRAEGVPLYAVETVRMLIDQGRLTEQDGRYRLAGPIGDLAVPASLTSLLGARIDALPEDERALLGHAAVLGQTFAAEALATVTGADVGSTRATLDRLVARDLLEVDDDPRSPERGQYGFVQGLLREVVYGRLSRRDRVGRHLAAAAYFEGQVDEDIAGVVASHLLDAHRAAEGAEAAALADRARIALLAAADRARDLHAWKRAIGYLDDAAAIAPTEDERLAIVERITEVGELGGDDPARIEALSREVLAWRTAQGDVPATAAIERRLGTMVLFQGRTSESLDILETAWARLREQETPETLRLGAELARAHLMSGQAEPAMVVIESLLPGAERLGADEVVAELLASKMWALGATGRIAEGVAIGRGNLVLTDRGHFVNARLRTAMNLSGQLADEDPRESFVIARDGLELARRLGYEGWAVSLAGNAGDAAFEAGDWPWVEAIVPTFDLQAIPALFGPGLLELAARVEAYQGRAAEADRTLAAAIELAGDVEDPQVRTTLLLGRLHGAFAAGADTAVSRLADEVDALPETNTWARLGSLLLAARASAWAGDPATAARFAAEARKGRRSRAVGIAWLDTEAIMALADAAAGRDTADAARRMDRAASRFREVGAVFLLALTRLERATFLRDLPGAAEAAEEARSILARLGANALLRRLDAAGWAGPPAPEPRAAGATIPAGATAGSPGATIGDPA